MSRQRIPSELKRQILVEAGHRCSIPTCRNLDVDIHHIIPWCDVKTHEYGNLIALCPNCHRRAEKGEIDRKSLYIYKDNLRYLIEKYSQFEIDVLIELSRIPLGHALPFPVYMSLLIKRLLEEEFVTLTGGNSGVFVGNIPLHPYALSITNKGRTFVNGFSKEKIGYES